MNKHDEASEPPWDEGRRATSAVSLWLTGRSPASPSHLITRHLMPRVEEALLDTPAVLINGPRQSGKTTLVRQWADRMQYVTLDDPNWLAFAKEDPIGLVRRLDRAIIDEVQRAPQLLLALKMAIDEDRRPGRFLLTGSANLMAMPQMADSLAGRLEVLTLLPLSQAELQDRPVDFLQRALAHDWPLTRSSWQRPTQEGAASAMDHILAGGYPEMRQRGSLTRRQAWARSYLQTLMERDVRDIAQIEQSSQMPALLQACSSMCGQLLNAASLATALKLNVRTLEKYLGILERLFLVQRLPAWARNDLSRLIKAPKIHFLDAGLQATLARLTPERLLTDRSRWGATVETWVHAELRKALTLSPEPWQLSHFRDKDQAEVDFVLESNDARLLGVEVKAAATVQPQDFSGLRRLRTLAGPGWVGGIVLYDGPHALSFSDGFWAVPLAAL